MTTDFDPAPAAELLLDAWRSGRQLTELPDAVRPRSMAEGYDVQDRLVAATGDAVVGWKLGVGSRKARREEGVGRAIAGRVLSRDLFRPGDAVPLPNHAPVTVEFEIAFVLGRDVQPGEAVPDPMSVVGEVRAAFELVLSRFVDRRAVGWPSFAADDAGFGALILGEVLDPATLDDVARTLSVSADGVDRAGAAIADDESVPLDALTDLLALAGERGMVLSKGSIVSTGTLSLPFAITGDARIEARYLDRSLNFSILRPPGATPDLNAGEHR